MSERFAFDEKKHIYTLDDKPLTGVTSVLRAIAKPALIQWAADMACDYIDQARQSEKFTIEDLPNILKEARLAHRKKKEGAGQRGKDVHLEVELLIKGSLGASGGILEVGPKHENPQIQQFIDWAVDNKVKFLVSEKRVYSETYWVAGTLDFLCEINGKKYVGDIKTSSAIYGREYFAQCAGYRMMLEEMGETGFTGSLIIRLGKNGESEVVFSEDYQNDKKLFLACLEVYRTMGTFEVEEIKLNESAKIQ